MSFTTNLTSQGVIGAEKGTLAIMVGGSKTSFDRSVPVLQSMARKVTCCGDLGAGLAAKISTKYSVPPKVDSATVTDRGHLSRSTVSYSASPCLA